MDALKRYNTSEESFFDRWGKSGITLQQAYIYKTIAVPTFEK